MKKNIAFFDFDGTITHEDTFTPFIYQSLDAKAIRQGKPLEDLPLSELQKFSQVIDEDVYPILSLQSCLDKRAAKGGVSPQQVAQAINEAKARLS